MEPSVLEQQVGVFFDDQAIDSLDELATLYNLRVSRTQQLLLETKEVHDIDTRVRRMGVYLQRHNAQLKAFTQECIEQDTPLDAGDVFSHAMVAFNSQDATWIAKLVTHYKDDPHARDGIVYALFYLPWGVASQWVADFLRSKEMAHKWLGVKACRLRNVYPGKLIRSLINRDDCQADVALYEQLLLLIGQMHDKSAASLVFNALEHDDESIKTAAYTASLMHNNKHVVSGAITHSLTTNAAFHALSPWIILGNTSAFANPYLSQVMAQTHIDYDLKIRAIGHHGDPATLAWLIKNTQADHLQPWVGLVFTQITGLDITAYSQRFPTISEDSEQATYLDEDNSLPFVPNASLQKLWRNVQSQFTGGHRYFLGRSLQQKERFSLTQRHASLIIAQQAIQYYTMLTDAQATYSLTIPVGQP